MMVRQASVTARLARGLAAASLLILTGSIAQASLVDGHEPRVAARLVGELNTKAFPKWSRVLDATLMGIRRADAACLKGQKEACRVGDWRRFLASIRGEEPASLLTQVNRYINRTRFRSDQANWGELDYWAGPDEFFTRGGDCEDYAIAKYYSLRALGFAASDLRITVLRDDRRQLLHAVLAVRYNGRFQVLDSLSRRIVTWSELPQYRVIYSVNEESFWLYPGQKPSKTAKL